MRASIELEKLFLRQSPLEKFQIFFEENGVYNSISYGDVSDSPIHLAVLNDRLDVVKLLVQNGASLEPLEIHPKHEDPYPEFQNFDCDDDRFTGDPLITAASRGKQEIFNFLAPFALPRQRNQATFYLAEGIKCNSVSSSDDSSAFQEVVAARPSSNDADAFGQWLTDLVQSTITELDQSAAMRSASIQFLEHCQGQIAQGLDVDHIGDNGCTFLWAAAHNGYIEAVRSLIELGASVDIPNPKDNWTPLMIAVDAHIPWTFGTMNVWKKAESHQVEIVNLLLQAGANVNHHGKNGETALTLAREYEKDNYYEEEILDTAICGMESALENAVS